MITQEDIIKGAVVNVMNFVIIRMLSTAFALAFEKGLHDLKEYMSPIDLCEFYKGHDSGSIEIELELIEMVEDKDVRAIVARINNIFDFLNIYVMINNLDIEEVITDPECTKLASDLYREEPINLSLNFEAQKTIEYSNFFWYNHAIWQSIRILLSGNTNEDEDVAMEEFEKQYFDFLDEDVTSDNRSVALLYDLQRCLAKGIIGRI
jgi:hypothetical protein